MNLFLSLGVSLFLTLALELAFGTALGVAVRDLVFVALSNILTNPAVVWCHSLVSAFFPALLIPATIALEAAAVIAEGLVYRKCTAISRPMLFSLGANLFSYAAGCILNALIF